MIEIICLTYFKCYVEKGIIRQLKFLGTLQQNGVAKEGIVHYWYDLVNDNACKPSISLWGAVCYTLNRVPPKSVCSTPYELWTVINKIDSFETMGAYRLCSFDITTS